MSYCICGEQFKTKDALKKRIQGILHSYSLEQTVFGDDLPFISAVLDLHPSRDIKVGCGVASIFVRQNPIYKRNRGFWIKREDGTSTDFSFMECLNPASPLQKFSSACRNAIRSDIVSFKIKNLNPWSICPFTGESLSNGNVHVDHAPPDTFEKIVNKFISYYKISIQEVPIAGSLDGAIGNCFSDKDMEVSFRIFHNSMAKLRIVSVRANLSNVKTGA